MRSPSFLLLAVAAAAPALFGCRGGITLMSYNVCGLDAAADGGAFERKCAVVAAALRRSVAGGPDVVAFQEVGGEEALRALRDGWLRGLGYGWYVCVGEESTAVRLGMIGRLPLLGVMVHRPAPTAAAPSPRPVLEVVCSAGGFALHILDNHWKSRIGGKGDTELARVEAARVVARRVSRILEEDPGAAVLVVGDLNEDHDGERPPIAATAPWRAGAGSSSAALLLVDDPLLLGDGGAPPRLYEPWFAASGARGSYAYEGSWGTPDHILLGAGLFDGAGLEYRRGSFRVTAGQLLVDPRTGLPRGHGRRGASEYSDHLPIVVTLDVGRRPPTAPRPAPRG